MKVWAKAFYHSTAWLACRDSYITSVDGLCERHLQRGQVVPGYIVHHKVELSPSNINDPGITLSHDNLEYLCLDCHNAEHLNKAVEQAPRFTYDETGQPIPCDAPSPIRKSGRTSLLTGGGT